MPRKTKNDYATAYLLTLGISPETKGEEEFKTLLEETIKKYSVERLMVMRGNILDEKKKELEQTVEPTSFVDAMGGSTLKRTFHSI